MGETYNVGGDAERRNIEVVNAICALLDARRPRADGAPRSAQISYVKDRPGHDRRYAIDATKLKRELGWAPTVNFEQGMARTVDWYLDNGAWAQRVLDGSYRVRAAGAGRMTKHARKGIILAGGSGTRLYPITQCDQQAAAAGVRQADDLLPAQRADAGRHPRGPGDQHAARAGRCSSACWATARSGA